MENFVIAITRTCGGGATSISKILAKKYHIDLYDRKLLQLASEDSGINEALFARADETTRQSLLFKTSRKVYNGEIIPPESSDFTSNDNLFAFQAKVLKELAKKESYVCIGRGADFILRDNPNMVAVFLYADPEFCIHKEMDRLGYSYEEARRYVFKTDTYREGYYKYHTGREWKNPYNYDLCLNTGKMSKEKAADIIMDYMNVRFGIPIPD
ncbi:MAG: cytidylate kinase-like family protein [Eubacteriales bacterium]|nr:cytidylate kinase-like family protein [Eubacteriales bacterium]